MKKILYFFMILAAVVAALGLASCGNDDDELLNRVYYTDVPIYIPYVNDFTCDYYTPDGEKIEDKSTAFNYNDRIMIKIGFTISADAFAAGKTRFTLKFKPSPGFEGRIISVNSSSTDDSDFTATFTTDNKPKNCYIQAEITFGYCSGTLWIKYRYDDEEYASASFGLLNHSNPIKFTYDVATDGYILEQDENKHFNYDANTIEMVIPDEYNGKPITGIGDNLFSSSRLGSITLPSTIQTIGDKAFQYCRSLRSIVIPDSVTSIGNNAFEGCQSLQSIVIPESVTSIGDEAFSTCDALKEVILPDGIKNIGKDAFKSCYNLTYSQYDKCSYLGSAENKYLYLAKVTLDDATGVTVHENCKIIGGYVFSGKDGSGLLALTSVNLPDGLKVIGDSAFSGCSALTSVNLPDGLDVIGKNAFFGCSALADMAIPDDIPDLGERVFDGCEKLYTEDEYGYYVTSKNNKYAIFIKEKGDFSEVKIKDGCVAIASYAFADNRRLGTVVLPDSLKSIGDYAFSHCDRLDDITIPSSVTSIGDCALFGCESLKAVTLPDTLVNLGSEVFRGCKSLESVTLPDTLVNLNPGTFYECESLKTVVLPKNLMRISDSAFAFCGIETLTLPDTLIEICASAFEECKNLQSLKIPDSVVNIGKKAFFGCYSLTSITLPATLERIEDETFKGCNSLEALQLPRDLNYIGYNAFVFLYSLEKLTFVGTRRAWMEFVVFLGHETYETDLCGIYCVDGHLYFDSEGYIYIYG